MSAPHRDANHEGLSAIFLLGEFTGGNFKVEGSPCVLDQPGKGMMIDGTKTHSSARFEGTRFSIVAFYHKNTSDLSEADRAYLGRLGFHLDASAAPVRRLVQSCCDDDNVLNKPNRYNKDCKMVNVTEYDDFTSREGIEKAKAAIQSALDALWNSAPCTGGSVLQYLNIAQRGFEALKKIAGHYKLFRKLWAAFEEVAEHAIALGAAVFLEWPRYNRYWKEKRVVKLLK